MNNKKDAIDSIGPRAAMKWLNLWCKASIVARLKRNQNVGIITRYFYGMLVTRLRSEKIDF